MKGLKSFLSFFVYSNLFIAGCALLMIHQTCMLLLHIQPGVNFLGFVFFSTLCSYSFHWYLTNESAIPSKRIVWMKQYRNIHLLLFAAGMAGAIVFFVLLREWWLWLLSSAVITFLYSAPKIPHPLFRSLRKIALGKTIFLAFVWTHVTTILPLVIFGQHWGREFTLFVIARFFLIYAICILFDYRDRADDKINGIRSLITYMDEKGINRVFAISLAIFGASTLMLLNYDFTILQVLILLLPGIIVGLLYRYAKTHFADLFYYFVLDGLMAFSAMVMLIFGNRLF